MKLSVALSYILVALVSTAVATPANKNFGGRQGNVSQLRAHPTTISQAHYNW